MSCQVTVNEGILQGQLCTAYSGQRYYSFEGIPYAKPPVGELRFRDPREPEKWTGILDATRPGNKCPQMNPKSGIEGSEDCLYLNIYTPSLPCEKMEKLPIIFFIHGGRFTIGYGHYYKPDYYIKQNVIIVTINYRLNILGFLCLNTPEVPGNAGIKDTVMALKWVKNNIVNFNGDINNVTVFGESAGSGIATSFLVSDMVDGLVNKIIAQSGVCVSDLFITDEDPIEKAKHVASILGRELSANELYDFLLQVPVEELIFASNLAEMSRSPGDIRAYFLPVVEKQFEGVRRFFDDYPAVAISKNRFRKLPILAGLNSHEGALFLRTNEHGNIVYEKDLRNFTSAYSFIDEDSKIKLAKRLQDFYFQGKEIGEKTKSEYLTFVSDAYFDRSFSMLLELMVKHSKNVYVYRFSYMGNMNTRIMRNLGVKGCSHGDLIQYQFYRKVKADKCTEEDSRMVDFLSEAWCNFVKHGKPTWTNQEIDWLPYNSNKRHCLRIGRPLKLELNVGHDRYCFWKKHFEDKCKL